MPKAKKMLSFDDIAAVDDRLTRDVLIPEWGGHIKVRALSVGEISAIEKKGKDLSDMERGLMLMQYGLCEPKLSDEQLRVMYDKSMSAITKVLEAINEVNELNGEDSESLKKSFREE